MNAIMHIVRSLIGLYIYFLRFFAANIRLRVSLRAKVLSAVCGIALLIAPCLMSLYLIQFTRAVFTRQAAVSPIVVSPIQPPLPSQATINPRTPVPTAPTVLDTTAIPQQHSALGDGKRVKARVIGATDGDTIEVQLGDTTEHVHLLGADTPEPGMCFGDKAAKRTHQLVSGQIVTLESDATQPNRDKYGRLSRYIWLANDQMLNTTLIKEGLAFEYTYFLAYTYQVQFQQLEATARSHQAGIWSSSTCNGAGQRPERRPQASTTISLPANLTLVPVIRVIDGDTIEVNVHGRAERVRFIGIDTPEVGRCYADQATADVTQLLKGGQVLLEADTSQDDRDKFGRLLRYIWLPDGQLVNYLLVKEGFAYEYTYRVAYRYESQFMQVEDEAHRSGLGLWSPTTCDGRAGRRYSSAYNTN